MKLKVSPFLKKKNSLLMCSHLTTRFSQHPPPPAPATRLDLASGMEFLNTFFMLLDALRVHGQSPDSSFSSDNHVKRLHETSGGDVAGKYYKHLCSVEHLSPLLSVATNRFTSIFF